MQPLAGIRVLAVTVYLAGPFASMSLARLGAEVIKVEIPGRGDPVRGNGPFAGPEGTHARRNSDEDISTRFLKRTQGVKSITLDLKTERGKELFLELAKQSDVVLENLAPGSLRRAGLGYEEVAAVNPGIVYASISGYGQTGAYKDKPAHDPQIQGMSGLMDINGEEGRPPVKVGFYIGDLVTPMFACYSILAALREKDRTGKGQYLDVSMMDTLVSLMFMENLEESIEAGPAPAHRQHQPQRADRAVRRHRRRHLHHRNQRRPVAPDVQRASMPRIAGRHPLRYLCQAHRQRGGSPAGNPATHRQDDTE